MAGPKLFRFLTHSRKGVVCRWCSLTILFLSLLTFGVACDSDRQAPKPAAANTTPTPTPTPEPDPEPDPDPIADIPNAPVIQLTGEGNQFNSFNPQLASNSTGVTYLVWQQCLFGDNCNKETIVAAKQNEDHTFSNPVEISIVGDGSANASFPSVAVDDDGVAHIVWLDDGSAGVREDVTDVLYRTWDGTSLGPLQAASNPGLLKRAGIVGTPQIALSQGSPHVVFHGDTGFSDRLRNYEILLARRGAEGDWGISQLSDSSHDGDFSGVPTSYFGSTNPSLVVGEDGTVHVVWQNSVPNGSLQVHYATVDSVGTTTTPRLVANGIETVLPAPKIALTEDGATSRVHVTWQYPRQCAGGGTSVGVRYGSLAGASNTFAILNEVTDESFCSAGSKLPSLAPSQNSDEPGVYVVWTSPHGGATDADRDIYLVRVDQGAVVGEAVAVNEPINGQNTSTTNSDSGTSIVIPGNILRSCWHERDTSASAADLDVLCVWRNL